MIGILGAMAMEIDRLKARLEDTTTREVAGMAFTTGRLAGVECIVAQCGVGKVNAAMCAQAMLLSFPVAQVVNIGVAGGVGEGLGIGDLVVADTVVQYDYDTTALGEPLGFLSRANRVQLPCDAAMARVLREAAREVYGGRVFGGCVATGDRFMAGGAPLEAVRRQFDPAACEMEGGAIGQVCLLNQTPFAVLRAISDRGDSDGGTDFLTFARSSAVKSQRLLEKALPMLEQIARG